MLSTAATILPVFLIILAGYGAARTGVVPAASAQTINRFVIWVPLPALMFHIVATADWSHMWNGKYVLVMLASSFAIFAIGMALGRLAGRSLADMAVDGLNASYSNAGYLGLPMLLLAIGPQSGPYVVVAFSLMLGALFAAATIVIELAESHGHSPLRAIGKASMGVIRNPVIAPPMLGLLWWLSGFVLPAPIDRFLKLLGDAASPTALAGIGLLLAQRPAPGTASYRLVLSLSFTKLVLHPLLTAFLAIQLFGLPTHIALIAVLISAMPTGTGPFMITGIYDREGAVTSRTILLSTVVSVFTITAILSLFPA